MTEEQIKEVILMAMEKHNSNFPIGSIRVVQQFAIEFATEKGLLTSTEAEPIKSEWPNPANVLWDKNESYGVKKETDPENKAHKFSCAYPQDQGPCDC